ILVSSPGGHLAAACPKSGTPSCYNFFLFLIGFIHFVQIKQKCGGEGHISKDCTNPTTPKSCYNCGDSGHIYSLGDQKCFHCGEVGHISRDCCVLKLRIVTPLVSSKSFTLCSRTKKNPRFLWLFS
ncbi:hypothetical protein MJO28_005393, partial [Puccinia striiformis f. sp. tritici]